MPKIFLICFIMTATSKRLIACLCLMFCWGPSGWSQQQPPITKILFVPLDDRPPCLQFPYQMGHIAGVELVSPPRELLGRFTQAGKSDGIIDWLATQDLGQFEAAIVSIDMLAYGGLVASRVHATPVAQAMSRVSILRALRTKAPRLKIYGSSVIMRLAPTADGKNEAYREKLSKWAEVSPYPEDKALTERLEKEIPAAALADYQQARERNLRINQEAIALVKEGAIDYLIVSQDDAKPRGIHVGDRETLLKRLSEQHLLEQVAVQPGADEVSMLLLARALSDKYHYHPKVKAVYSSSTVAEQVMPFEDRPLGKTVSFHLKAVGAQEVTDPQQADLVFFVFATRFEAGSSGRFAQEIVNFTKKHPKKGVIVVDIDPKGDVQGGDVAFTESLYRQGVFKRTYGYGSWNTAGNAIGTALPHGIVHGVSRQIGASASQAQSLTKAQRWFTLNRLLDDFAYHSIVRPAAQQMGRDKGWNVYRLSDTQTQEMEAYCLEALGAYANKLKLGVSRLRFDLPWNRTFEAEIDFEIR